VRAGKLGTMSEYTLILLRHGNSVWNQQNLFTGWVDVELSDQGRAEAKRAGELLAESGIKPDLLYTSRLKRAINTLHSTQPSAHGLM
jgi:2,3-bisphosphoglycerate-dependent phosphoglycerate mutase